jgi:hypothetical protein
LFGYGNGSRLKEIRVPLEEIMKFRTFYDSEMDDEKRGEVTEGGKVYF